MKTFPVSFAVLLANLKDPDSQVRLRAICNILRRPNERGMVFSSLLTLLNDSEKFELLSLHFINELVLEILTVAALSHIIYQGTIINRHFAVQVFVLCLVTFTFVLDMIAENMLRGYVDGY